MASAQTQIRRPEPPSSRRRGGLARLARLAGYGVGDFGLNIYWNAVSIWLIYFYTMIVGLPPSVAGVLFFIGMAWDALSDPVVATLSERVRTRHGTYRPFLLFGSVGLGLLATLLFWVPPFTGVALIAVLILVTLAFRTAYTLVAVPYSAMSARITYDSVERTELSGARMFFAFAGLLVVSYALPPLMRGFSKAGEGYTPGGFQSAIMVGAALATLAILICFASTREQPIPAASSSAGISTGRGVFGEMARILRGNGALRILLVIIFLQSGAVAGLMTSLVFFIEANAERFAAKEDVLGAFALATLLAVPLWTLLIRRFGKKVCWVVASLSIGALGLHMWAGGPLVIAGLPIQVIGIGAVSGAFGILVWAFVPDTVEYGQLATGTRNEGAVFGSVLVVQKLSGGLAGLGVGMLLARIGLADGQLSGRGADEVAQGLAWFLAVIPTGLLVISVIPVLSMPLDRRIHADIVDTLRRDGSSSAREGRRTAKGDT